MVKRALTCILPFLLLACRPAVPADPYALEASPSPVFISEYRVLDGWLELCNPADTTVSLVGYRLIVDGKDQDLSTSAMGPQEYRLVEDIESLPEAVSCFLLDGEGRLVDILDPLESKKHKSIVREMDSAGEMDERSEEDLTPGYSNDETGRKAYQATRRRPNRTGIAFSEISASGDSDFVELYNPTGKPADLSGFGLSDKENYSLFRFPDKTILLPGGYLAVYCDSAFEGLPPSDTLRAPFSIGNGKDWLYLSDPDGNIVLEYGPVGMPKGESLVSLRGCPFITSRIITPGRANEAAGNAPAATVASGQYDGVDTLKVELFALGEIHYSTDGSIPDHRSPKYEKPFLLTKTAVIRAIAYGEDGSASPVGSYTYIINEGHVLDVVSLVSDPGGLFSTGSGIYSNGPYRLKPNGTEEDGTPGINYPYIQANYWRKWWRLANVSLLPREGVGFSYDCGASIFGGYSRINAKKSLKFTFKSAYGPSKLHYPLFPNRDIDEYNSFVMRSGGQDAYGTLIKDDLASYLADGLIDVMATRPAIFYINGQYYGLYYIREKINEHYIEEHYNIPTDSLDIVAQHTGADFGSAKEWRALLSYARSHDLSQPQYYAYVCDRMDVQSYADWIVAEIWLDNKDPGNVRCFKSPHLDNKWRWILYDVDMGLNGPRSDGFLLFLKPTSQPLWQTDLIRALLKNPDFRALFAERMEYQMTYIWNKDRVNAAIDHFARMIGPEVERNNKRWMGDYKRWTGRIDGLHQYADGRQAYLKEQFANNAFLKQLLHFTPEELDRCFGH